MCWMSGLTLLTLFEFGLSLLLADGQEPVRQQRVCEGEIRTPVLGAGLLPLHGTVKDRFSAIHEIEDLQAAQEGVGIAGRHGGQRL
jgi:hypothetical protein